MKKVLLACSVLLATACGNSPDQNLKLNELEYFETQGVNVLVYSNLFSGGFNDEKNSGIELHPPWCTHCTRWGHQAFQYSRTMGFG